MPTLFLRSVIVGSLFAVAIRFDRRKLALVIGVLVAVLLTVVGGVFTTEPTDLAVIGFAGDLAVCLAATTIFTADPGGIVWVLTLMGSSFLLIFQVPLEIARNLLGG